MKNREPLTEKSIKGMKAKSARYIMFDPETTIEELRENIDFLHRNELTGRFPHEHLFNALKLYPGTPARQRYVDMLSLDANATESLIPPFTDPRVETVFRIVIAFWQRVQPIVSICLLRLDRKVHAGLGQAEPLSYLDAREVQRWGVLVVRI